MEKTVLQVDTEKALEGPLRSAVSAADTILASAADTELWTRREANAPLKESLARDPKKHREERLACTGGKSYYPFCLKPLEVDTVQEIRIKPQIGEMPSSRALEQQSTNRHLPEDLTVASNTGITIENARSSASRKSHGIDTHQINTAGARLLASGSSASSEIMSLQQNVRGTCSSHNSSGPPSQQQDKQQSILNVAPMAVKYPAYGEHFRYELSECKAFWSCDLHYRDWRQIFAASPFPDLLPPNRLFVVRFLVCMIVFVTEIFATLHSYRDTGWPTYLYFTNTNCIFVTVSLLLMTAVSFHSLTVWKEPLFAKPTCPTDSQRASNESTTIATNTQSASVSTIARLSGINCSESVEKEQQVGTNKDYMASTCLRTPEHESRLSVREEDCTKSEDNRQPRVSFVTEKIEKVVAEVKKMWRLQGYKDLLADQRFCVKEIIFAPNPTDYPSQCEDKGSICGCGLCHTSGGQKQRQRPLVRFLWILHSVQLISSTTVSIIFFAMMRANGTTFTDFWYTGWRHLALIVITVLHSVLLTRLPVPVCHAIFFYIISALYVLLQVFVFVFDLPNGQGDNGCVYRVGTLKRPFRFALFTLVGFAVIAGVTVMWWSLLRHRSADVNPPPSVSVPAARLLERQDFAEEGDTEALPKQRQRNCFGAQLLRSWKNAKCMSGINPQQMRAVRCATPC